MVAIHYAVLKNNTSMVHYLIEHKSTEIVVGALKKELAAGTYTRNLDEKER